MAERLHPGVYIEEVSSGVRPIEGVSTSTTAFLGKAERGPHGAPLMVTSFTEFQAKFGGFLEDSYLSHAALSYFNNGGKRLYVLRVARNPAVASVSIGDRKATPVKTLSVSASSPGAWGNALDAIVAAGTLDAADEFKLTVNQSGVAAEVFDNLSMNPSALNYVETVVNARSRLVRVTVDTTNDSTAKGKSTSGASPATQLGADKRQLVVNVNGDGPQTITLEGTLTTADAIKDALKAAVSARTPLRSTTPAGAFTDFDVSVAGTGEYVLTSGVGGKRSSVVVTDAPSANAAAALKLGANRGGSEATGAAELRPANGTYLLGDGSLSSTTLAVTPGTDGATPDSSDYIGALTGLDPLRDLNLVAVPGTGAPEVVEAASNYCAQRMDCFFIADMTASETTKEAAQTYVNGLTVKSSYAAVYFPWLKMVDPTGRQSDPILVPPSGFVAGIYARTDSRRGAWKAPAGTEANVGGSVGLARVLSDAEQDTLNPLGVNALRFFPASGIVVWGARTLATRSDPEYRYVPIRRLAIFLEQSIYAGIQWAVFEPNDEDLWASLRLNIGAFMLTQFRSGAFQGDTPSKAFFVKCDAETNPQDQIDAGIVTVMVGFAPLRPAEFVVLRVSQKTAQAAA
jgi:phage tail sheath protein FI